MKRRRRCRGQGERCEIGGNWKLEAKEEEHFEDDDGR